MRLGALLVLIGLVAASACADGGSDAGSSAAAVNSGPPRLGASDVTVLMPLGTLDAMMPHTGLLPDAIATQIGQLVDHYTADDTLARLRVVCARFDACAPKPGGDRNACVGEVRVVLQPLLVTDGLLGAQDAAIHVFYDLDDATKRDLAAKVAALPGAGANTGAPLAVSARMTNPDYATALTALISDFTTRGVLSRVTFLRNTDVKGNGWMFGGFDIAAGVASPLVVPRVAGSQQGVIVNGSGPFASSLSPAPSGADTLGMLLDPIRLDILNDANPSSAKQAILTGEAAATALEDPAKHDATTADCASCHLAESARIFGHQYAAQQGYEPACDARTLTAAETLRACGYVGTKPVLSERTKNESALAAQRMGDLLP